MAEITVKRVEEMNYYKGPNAIPGIKFHTAARDLGVTAWGMGVLELEPNCANYPQHDHVENGQEEVYTALKGGGTIEVGARKSPLEPGTFVRVPPDQKRKIVAGDKGMTVLAIGSTPGKAYEPRK